MMLYILRYRDPAKPDTTDGLVIRAGSEKEARQLAMEETRCEEGGGIAWIDLKTTVCERLTASGAAGVVAQSILRG
jgi:hypothetical protein